MRRLLLLICCLMSMLLLLHRPPKVAAQQTVLYGFSGWATYYGIEDGFVRGDVMFDGTMYDPADPNITAASFLIPLHTWLRVCSPANCIVVQVRDRGLLDENTVLLDLSRAAYARLFGGLGGRQWVSAYFSDSSGSVLPGLGSLAPPAPGAPLIPAPVSPTPSPSPRPDRMQW